MKFHHCILMLLCVLFGATGCGIYYSDYSDKLIPGEVVGQTYSNAYFSATIPEGWMPMDGEKKDNIAIFREDNIFSFASSIIVLAEDSLEYLDQFEISNLQQLCDYNINHFANQEGITIINHSSFYVDHRKVFAWEMINSDEGGVQCLYNFSVKGYYICVITTEKLDQFSAGLKAFVPSIQFK